MKYYIYWIHLPTHTNIFSEGYIGISKNPKRRFKDHKYTNQNPHLKYALEKYKNEIIWDIILIGSKEYCLEIEEKLRLQDHIGWNIAKGGGMPPSSRGRKLSEKHKKLLIEISHNRKGKKTEAPSEETKQKISKANKGQIHSEKTKQEMSIKATKRWLNPGTREQQSKQKKEYYEEHPEVKEQHSEKMKKCHEEHPELIENIRIKNSKTWKIISPSDEEFIIFNLNKYCKENNLSHSHLSKGRYKGWKAALIN